MKILIPGKENLPINCWSGGRYPSTHTHNTGYILFLSHPLYLDSVTLVMKIEPILAARHGAPSWLDHYWSAKGVIQDAEEKVINGLILSYSMQTPILLMCYAWCAYLCNYDMTILRLDLRLAPQEGIHAWHCKPDVKPMAWEVADPNEVSSTVVCQIAF